MGMSEIRFELKPVAEKRRRGLRRESKYAPILDRFIGGEHDLVKVAVENRDANYMRVQLIKLIEARGLEDRVKASVANGELYWRRFRSRLADVQAGLRSSPTPEPHMFGVWTDSTLLGFHHHSLFIDQKGIKTPP